MAFASLKKPQVATVVDPNEYTFGKDGILTLLPLSGVRGLQHSRHLFKAWVLDKVTLPRGVPHLGPGTGGSGVGGVPHPMSGGQVNMDDVPCPGEPDAPVPACWGNDPRNAAQWCAKMAGHCPRLIVEIMHAVATQMGKEDKERFLAFSTRTYQIIQQELLTLSLIHI